MDGAASDDEESSAMTIPIDSYDISEMGSNGDADNDAHTRFVLERNRKAGGLTAMCHDGHSCLMKTMAHPPGKADYWLVKQKEVAAHYKPTVEYYRAECGGRAIRRARDATARRPAPAPRAPAPRAPRRAPRARTCRRRRWPRRRRPSGCRR